MRLKNILERKYLAVFFLSLLLTFIIGRNFILGSGYIYLFENFEVYRVQEFWKVFYPSWNTNLQTFNFLDLPKLYIYFPITLIASLFNSYKLLQIILLLLPFPVAFVSAFLLSEHFFLNKLNKKHAFLSALVSAFIFTVNPWFVIASRNIFLRFQYAFLPLVVYLFLKILKSHDRKYIFYFALVMSVVSGNRYILLTFLLFALIFILNSFFSKNLFQDLKKITEGYILFFLFSLGKFLPLLFHSLYSPIQAVSLFNMAQVNRETLLHIFTTKIYEWRAFGFNMIYNDKTHFLFIPVIIFSFSYFFLHRQKRKFYLLLPPFIFLAFTLLSAKELNLDFFIFHLPFFDFTGRLLRHARWNVMPVVLSISVMAGLSSSLFLSRAKSRAYIILSLILLLASLSAWPMFTGDMNGYWRPAEPPEDYVKANDILENGTGHVLWFPHIIRRATWSRQRGEAETSAPMDNFPVRSSALPSYSAPQSYFFDYYNFLKGGPAMSPFEIYEGNLSKIYEPLNVNYIAFHYDGAWTREEQKRGFTNEYIHKISENTGMEKLYEGRYISLFAMNGSGKFAARKPVSVSDSLKTLGYISSVSKKIPGIIFWDRGTDGVNCQVMTEWKTPVLLKYGHVISPKDFSKDFAPERKWSPSFVDQPDFQYRLWWKGVKWNWDFDYGRGVVFTWAPDNLSIPLDFAGNFRLFVRYMESDKGGKIRLHFNHKTFSINTSNDVTRVAWKDMGLHHFERGNFILENAKGLNVVNVFVLIPEEEYEKAITSFQNRTLVHVFYPSIMHRENQTFWQSVELLNGSYRLALYGDGNFSVDFSNHTFDLNSTNFSLLYTPSLDMEQGTYNLRVNSHKNSSFAAVWIFSGSQTLEKIFSFKEAEIKGYEKINPTFYKVNVSATGNFLLSFAEGYDPLWEAEIYRDGERIGSVNSVPLYSVINGFWINETGELNINVRYIPEEWFRSGLCISVLAIVLTVYLWRDALWKRTSGQV